MFKNLKNRLDSEAEKIKQSVQNYGGQVAAQVGQYRQAMNEGQPGSESGTSISKRFMNSVSGTPNAENSDGKANESMESSSAMMSEIPEADLLGLGITDSPPITSNRQRKLSNDSTHSNESTLASLLQSIPNVLSSALDTIPSDSESIASEAFSVRSTNDPAYTSKLKQRLSTYKAKYRDAVHRHNKLVDDVNNTKKMLETTQDEYLKKVEKLRQEKRVLAEKLQENSGTEELEKKCEDYKKMLEQCKVKIRSLQEKKDQLISVDEEENPKVKELEAKIEKVEDEWTKRMNDSDQQHAITLATTKAEMHVALENKDSEIEQWRRKCVVLEQADADANQRWQQKVEKVQAMNKALEAEKNEMVDKLSEAKQQGVKAVLEEEERKLKEMENQMTVEIEKLKEENEQMRLEMHSYKVQLEANESKEFDESREDAEAVKLELARAETAIAEHLNNFKIYQQEAEKALAAEKERLEISQTDCDEWREKYEQRACDADRISTVEFEMTEQESKTKAMCAEMQLRRDELEAKCEELTKKFETVEQEKNAIEKEMTALRQEMNEKCENLRKELEAAKKLSEDVEARFEEVSKKAEQMKMELEENRKSYEEEKKEIQMTLESRTQKDGEVAGEIQTFKAQIEALQKEKEELLEKFRTFGEEKKDEVEKKQKELEELKEKYEQVEKEKAEEIEKLKTQLEEDGERQKKNQEDEEKRKKEVDEKVEELEKELEATKAEIQNERKLKEAMEKNDSEIVSEYKTQYEEAKGQKEAAVKELEESKGLLKGEVEKKEKAMKQHEDALDKIQKLYTHVAELREEKVVKVQEVEKRMGEEKGLMESEHQKALTEVQEQLHLKTMDWEKAEKRIVEMEENQKGRIEELEGQLRSTVESEKTRVVELEEQLKNEKEEGEKRILELTEQKKKLEETLEAEKADESQKNRIVELEEELKQKASELQTSQQENQQIVENLKKEEEAQKLTVSNLEKQIRQLEESQKTRIAELEEQLKNGRAEEQETFEKKMVVLQEQVRTKEDAGNQEIQKLNTKIEEMEKALMASEQISKSLTEEINVLTTTLQKKDEEIEKVRAAEEEKLKEVEVGEEMKRKMEEMVKEKENVITELRNELKKNGSEIVVLKATVEKVKMDMEECDGREKRGAANRENEKKEEMRLRETFANELDNSRKQLEEKDAAYTELKGKAEKKLMKIKTQFEEKNEAMKKELNGKIEENEKELEEARRMIETKEKEKEELERQVGGIKEVEEKMKKVQKELDEAKKDGEEKERIMEENEKELKENEKMMKEKKDVEEELRKKIGEMEEEVKKLKDVKESRAAKADTDAKRNLRELQKEVKQLYNELNEKNQQFDNLQSEMEKLKAEKASSTNGNAQEEEDKRSEFSYKEEIQSLRHKLTASLTEADDLRLQVSRKDDKKPNGAGKAAMERHDDLHSGIANPAEAEYLKNVLYRYMTNREALGKESITLAKVIGTVARFDTEQMKQVIYSEESRQASWTAAVGESISHSLAR